MNIDFKLVDCLLRVADSSYLKRLLEYLNELKEGPDTYVCFSKDDIDDVIVFVKAILDRKDKTK